MQIKIIKGCHLTATERKAIAKMFERGWTTARNLPKIKSYKITDLTAERFDIKIGTKAVRTIGDIARWKYFNYTIEYKN